MSNFPTIEQYDVVILEGNDWYYRDDFNQNEFQTYHYEFLTINVPVPEDCPDLEALIDSALRSMGYLN